MSDDPRSVLEQAIASAISEYERATDTLVERLVAEQLLELDNTAIQRTHCYQPVGPYGIGIALTTRRQEPDW